jgi:hypothetical protein
MNTNFVRQLLYEFKKDYGEQIRYISIAHSEMQVETGERNFIKTAYIITAIPLPKQLSRKFIQDIGYLAANKNFTYGGFNDYIQLKLIIDAEDFPKGLEPELTGYIVYNNKRYEKVEFEILEHKLAYIVTAKGVEGSKPYDIMTLKAFNTLQFQSGPSYELN